MRSMADCEVGWQNLRQLQTRLQTAVTLPYEWPLALLARSQLFATLQA